VSKQTNSDDRADLMRTNAELSASLQRCRQLLEECRSKLVANGNAEAIGGSRKRSA
jgi:hypothetical protein